MNYSVIQIHNTQHISAVNLLALVTTFTQYYDPKTNYLSLFKTKFILLYTHSHSLYTSSISGLAELSGF